MTQYFSNWDFSSTVLSETMKGEYSLIYTASEVMTPCGIHRISNLVEAGAASGL